MEAGFIFSGNVGTGLLFSRNKEGKWSAPCAIGLSGVGWGLIAGASIKDFIYFIYSENTMTAIAGDFGAKMSGRLEMTVGPFG